MKIIEKQGGSIQSICDESFSEQLYISREPMPAAAVKKPSLLLHSCCGPCSTAVVFELIPFYHITVYFYNPNITDFTEYEKRRESQKKFISEYNEVMRGTDKIEFIEGAYEPDVFLNIAKGLEAEREGGKRCRACFRLRLEKTAETASLRGFDCFATTLCVSPYKDYAMISQIGCDLCAGYGIGFVDRDYKKNDGYRRSVELSKEYSLYRQNYCGCAFSNTNPPSKSTL